MKGLLKIMAVFGATKLGEIVIMELTSKYQSGLKILIQVSKYIHNHSLNTGMWRQLNCQKEILFGNK